MLGTVADASSLTLGLPILLFPSLPLLRRDCSWSNSKSSSRWVRASFCWIAMRNREFRVFFSSSAAASCLCISSSCVTYSSHLRKQTRQKSGELVQEPTLRVTAFLDCSYRGRSWPKLLPNLIVEADSLNSSIPTLNECRLGSECHHFLFSKRTCIYKIRGAYDNVVCFQCR